MSDFPEFSLSEVQEALSAVGCKSKPTTTHLSQTAANSIKRALLDLTNRGFSAMLIAYYCQYNENWPLFGDTVQQLCEISQQAQNDYERQYSLLALARLAAPFSAQIEQFQAIENIAALSGNLLSETALDAPALLIREMFKQQQHVSDQTAQRLLVYLVQRLSCQNGADDGFQLRVILQALLNVTNYQQFCQQAISARVITGLTSYLSACLNSNAQPHFLTCSTFDVLYNILHQIENPADAVENDEFQQFLLQEFNSLSEMDFYGVIRYFTLPTAQEAEIHAFDGEISSKALKFLAEALKYRQIAETAFQHCENGASQTTVRICDFCTALLQRQIAALVQTKSGAPVAEGQVQSAVQQGIDVIADTSSVLTISTYFMHFRPILLQLADSQFPLLVNQLIQYIIQYFDLSQQRDLLERLFKLILMLSQDAFAFIDSSKLYFDDFALSQRTAIGRAGQQIYGLLDNLLILCDMIQFKDSLLYEAALTSLYSLCQFSVPLMPFLAPATSLDLLRSKFKAVRPSRLPPVSPAEIKALTHLINQKRSVKTAAIVPFALRILCKIQENAQLIVQKSVLQQLSDELDWMQSSDCCFSKVNFSLQQSKSADEVSEETLFAERQNVQYYVQEVLLEILQLANVFAYNNEYEISSLSSILNNWAQLASIDENAAQKGASAVKAILKNVGDSGLKKMKSQLSDAVLKMCEDE